MTRLVTHLSRAALESAVEAVLKHIKKTISCFHGKINLLTLYDFTPDRGTIDHIFAMTTL